MVNKRLAEKRILAAPDLVIVVTDLSGGAVSDTALLVKMSLNHSFLNSLGI